MIQLKPLNISLTPRLGGGSTRAAPSGLAAPPPSPARADGHAPLRGGIRTGSVARLLARLEGRSGAEPKGPREGSAEPPGAEGGRGGFPPGPAAALKQPQGGAAAGGAGGGRRLRPRWYGDTETERIARILRAERGSGAGAERA